MLPQENYLFGCTRSKSSQGSVPAGLALASDFSFCFQCKVGSSLVLRRPIETALNQALRNRASLQESDTLHVMAAFDRQEQTNEALDWAILRDGGNRPAIYLPIYARII